MLKIKPVEIFDLGEVGSERYKAVAAVPDRKLRRFTSAAGEFWMITKPGVPLDYEQNAWREKVVQLNELIK